MATNFPASLDSLTNPTSSDSLNSPSHSAQHANVNDAVEALQAKVGVDSSAVTTSLDYKVAALEGRDTAGLVLVSSTTIGTAVSSVTVSGAFSADYENYKITVNGGVGSIAQTIALKLGASTANYYQVLRYYSYTGTATTVPFSNASSWSYAGEATSNNITMNVELQNPFLANYTTLSGFYPGSVAGWLAGYHGSATSYTDFTISVAGTLTGGTINVYGYAKA